MKEWKGSILNLCMVARTSWKKWTRRNGYRLTTLFLLPRWRREWMKQVFKSSTSLSASNFTPILCFPRHCLAIFLFSLSWFSLLYSSLSLRKVTSCSNPSFLSLLFVSTSITLFVGSLFQSYVFLSPISLFGRDCSTLTMTLSLHTKERSSFGLSLFQSCNSIFSLENLQIWNSRKRDLKNTKPNSSTSFPLSLNLLLQSSTTLSDLYPTNLKQSFLIHHLPSLPSKFMLIPPSASEGKFTNMKTWLNCLPKAVRGISGSWPELGSSFRLEVEAFEEGAFEIGRFRIEQGVEWVTRPVRVRRIEETWRGEGGR